MKMWCSIVGNWLEEFEGKNKWQVEREQEDMSGYYSGIELFRRG